MVVNKNNFISLVFLFCFFLVANISSAVAQDGPHNLGFENGESNWTRVSESESISVVGTQGADSSPTYADLGITVSPDKGSYMLSLGAPKQKSENMNLGSNAVRQTFNSYSDAIVLSFRLFSWEFRVQDSFTIDVIQTSDLEKNFVVQDSNGGNLSVTMYEGQTAQICSATPCVLKPFSGKSGNLVNTGWKRVIVSGLPTDGSEVSISYDLEGVKDQGHPSWAYVDSWNNDPVANFTVSRESTIEGNVSRFIDKSTDQDPGDEITKRIWDITYSDAAGGSKTVTKYDAKEVAVIASNQGSVTAKLNVFDRFGGSDDIESGGTGPDGIAPTITFDDGEILVNKLLAYNVVTGSKGNILTARYAKPGWDDQVSASWTIITGDGTLVQSEAKNIQYPIPMMLKGVAYIPFDAPEQPGTSTVTLTLSDPVGASVTSDITINVHEASDFTPSAINDGNDTPATATLIKSGTVNVGHLNKLGDVDYYKITDADGNKFPVGSEIYINLANVSVDHDLFIISKAETVNGENADWLPYIRSARLPYIRSARLPYIRSARLPYIRSARLAYIRGARLPYIRSARLPYIRSARLPYIRGARLPYIRGARLGNSNEETQYVVFTNPSDPLNGWEETVSNSLLHSTWLRDSDIDPFSNASSDNGFDFDQIPISEAVFLPTPYDNINQKDIDISETAFANISDTGYRVSAVSANDGFNKETLLVRVLSEDDIYLAVSSEGEFGSPYTLQVENSKPTSLEAISNGACVAQELVQNGVNTLSAIATDSDHGDSVMYVVNPQRMKAKYGEQRWSQLNSELKTLAQLEGGKILEVHEVSQYADMDKNPCDVAKANVVATAIRDAISVYRGEAENVVMVGDDSMLPFYRAIDPSDFTERDYVASTRLSVNSPMYSAMFNSYILTDKYYASDYDISIMPANLLIPNWGVSRLVETPEDIIASIDHHKTNLYGINMETAMVSAYDIVLDGGIKIAKTLSDALTLDNVLEIPPKFDLTNLWYATSIHCNMLGDEAISIFCASKDIVSLNGHFTHDMLISQAAYKEVQCDPSLSDEGCDKLKFLYPSNIKESTYGNISGNFVYTPGCHGGLNVPSPANISLLEGDSRNSKYDDFPESYLGKGATYLASTGYGIAGINSIAYSEKLMDWNTKTLLRGGSVGLAVADAETTYIINALYEGLSGYDIKAMYQNTLYGFSQTVLSPGIDIPINETGGGCDTASNPSFSLTVLDGSVTNDMGSVTLNKVCTTNAGDYYEVDGSTNSVVNRPIQPLAGYTYTSNEVGDIRGIVVENSSYTDELIDPVFLTPSTDNDRDVNEASFCQVGRYWPSKPVDYSNSDTDTSLQFTAGQFFCDDEAKSIGTQRLYTQATVRVLRSTSEDHTSPLIHYVEPQVNEQGNVVYFVAASDDSGINEIMLTIYLDNSIKTITSAQLSGDGPYEIELSPVDSQLALNNNTSVTVIDGANNTAVASAKGRGIKQILVNIKENNLVSTLSPKQLTATIPDFVLRKAAANSMSYVWDFGDGQYETGALFNGEDNHPDVVVNGESASITTTHTYKTDSNIKVKFKVTDSSGGIGSDTLDLRSCSDPSDFVVADADLVQCDVTSTDTQINIIVKVADGGTISSDVQYRLYLDYTNDGVNDLKLTYDNNSIGKNNKVGGLIATVSDDKQSLLISFDLAPTGWTKNMPLNWYMETQSGVEKVKGAGSADVMPDTGYFSY